MQVKSQMDYYAWRPQGKPVEVRLNLPMLGYMVPWMRERDLQPDEAFGILLGSVTRRRRRVVVTIDDFEPFNPAKLHGPPQPPPGNALNVVGLYRRRDGQELKLDGLDASFIQSSFHDPGMVYLLVCPSEPGPDRAAFFIQERGEIHGYTNYGEFPFDADALRRFRPSTHRARRWILGAGLVSALLILGAWFVWLRQATSAPVAIATPVPKPVSKQPVSKQPVSKPEVKPPAPHIARIGPPAAKSRATRRRATKKSRAR